MKEKTNEVILDQLKEMWKTKFAGKKAAWDQAPKWPAKLVSTSFKLNDVPYTIRPADIGLNDDCWDQGFMESIQGEITSDLKAHGATDIYNTGYLD